MQGKIKRMVGIGWLIICLFQLINGSNWLILRNGFQYFPANDVHVWKLSDFDQLLGHFVSQAHSFAPSSLGNIPPSSLCPPRRWSGAGVWVGMLRGAGDSLTWKYKSHQLFISCFLMDMKFISKSLKMFYGDLRHFPVPVFDFSTFQIFKNYQFRISKCTPFKLQNLKNNISNASN